MTTLTYDQILAEVLQAPARDNSIERDVPSFKPRKAGLLRESATKVREAYLAGVKRVRCEPDDPTPFFEECSSTVCTVLELNDAIEDEALLSLALGICEEANLIGTGATALPTTLPAKVNIQTTALEEAKRLYALLKAEIVAFLEDLRFERARYWYLMDHAHELAIPKNQLKFVFA